LAQETIAPTSIQPSARPRTLFRFEARVGGGGVTYPPRMASRPWRMLLIELKISKSEDNY
jgi:hypothetical protein